MGRGTQINKSNEKKVDAYFQGWYVLIKGERGDASIDDSEDVLIRGHKD